MPPSDPSPTPPPRAPRAQPQDATVLMIAAAAGDKAAGERLLPLVYEQLRKAAQLSMANERPGHTLSATALVHEAYVKLAGPRDVPWAGRGHFYAAAAEAMRQILLDYAKSRLRLKRGGSGAAAGAAQPEPAAGGPHDGTGAGDASNANAAPARRRTTGDFEDVAALARQEPEEIVRFDELVRRLENESPDGAAIVRLRFFAGLSVEQTAQALGLSTSTVDRRWAFARAWLFQRMLERA